MNFSDGDFVEAYGRAVGCLAESLVDCVVNLAAFLGNEQHKYRATPVARSKGPSMADVIFILSDIIYDSYELNPNTGQD